MTESRNRHLAPVAVIAAALIAAGTAYAASRLNGSSSSSPGASEPLSATPISSGSAASGHDGPGREHRHGGGDEFAAAATYLGVSQADLLTSLQSGKTLAQIADATSGKSAAGLIDALVAAEKTELATAVAAGTITQAQSDQIASTLTARVTARVNGTEPEHGRHGFGGPGLGHRGDDFTAAATYLGVTEAALSTQLQAGKTLAQVADATSGKSAAGLVDALVAHETAELDAAVTAGRITQAQRDQMVPMLKARFTALVNGTRPSHDGLRPGYRVAPGDRATSGNGTHI
jgi:hypothetical protein